MHIHPIIMSGGVGSRLWPASRRVQPKQMHALVTTRSMLQETAARVQSVAGEAATFGPVSVITSSHLGEASLNQLRDTGVSVGGVVMEPQGRNTAPATAVAALHAAKERPDALVLLLPADHHIADAAGFRAAIARGVEAAAAGRIVTYGIVPARPETGYGYILAGDALDGGTRAVDAFVEKPNRETAQEYMEHGRYFWNAGIFLYRADTMLAEMERHCPKILAAAREAFERADRNGDLVELNADAYALCPEDSVDYAVMEKTDRAAIAPMDVAWSDLGSWAALWETAMQDERGVASNSDDAVLIDTDNTIVHSTGPTVACVGVSDLVVVATGDAVLVVPRDQAQRVKDVVNALKSANRLDLL